MVTYRQKIMKKSPNLIMLSWFEESVVCALIQLKHSKTFIVSCDFKILFLINNVSVN